MKIDTLAAALAGLLASWVCTVVSQTCGSYTAGLIENTVYSSSSSGGIYVNDAPAHRAPCDGTVYAWHYCYYPENDEDNVRVAFGAYECNPGNGQFILRDGSYYLLHLESREDSFSCGTVTLSPSQYFQIYDGDRVGACLRNNGFEFLNILVESAPSSFKVARWGDSSESCEENDMRQSTGDLENIDECAVGEDNCHPTLASCTDIVGESGSFECTCITGYTGDGVTCTDFDACSSESNSCVENANCVNTLGNYTCVCASGYSGDGFSSCVSDEQSKEAFTIGLSVAIAGLVIIATALILIILLTCLLKRNKLISTRNVTSFSDTHSSSLKSYAAYTATSEQGPAIHTNINEAYALPTSINEAYGIPTITNEGNDIMTTTNEAYEPTYIPTSTNQAYQTTSATNPLTYDYAYDYIPHTT